MPELNSYHIRWKGQRSGPFPLDEIESKILRREISVLHEIEHQGRWVTLRAFLAQRAEKTSGAPPPPSRNDPSTVTFVMPGRGQTDVPGGRGKFETTTPPGSMVRTGAEPSFYVHAGFAQRGVAALIDAVPLGLAIWGMVRGGLTGPGPAFSLHNLLVPPGLFWFLGLLVLIVPVSALLESSPLQGTPGKWVLGLVVTDRHGQQLAFGASAKRAMLKLMGALPFGFGWFMAAFNREGRALHDVLAETSVVFRVTASSLLR